MTNDVEVEEKSELLLIDKPLRWSSFDAVKKIKYAGKYRKIGHAGTLDPLATGLLILCTGKMTKQIDQYQQAEKEYTGTLVLGKTTPSVDLETDFDATFAFEHLTETDLITAARNLEGVIDQLPPIYSAVRVDGERLYKKARRGETVEIKPRTVTIKAFELTRISLPEVDFRIICSKGTYIRSMVRDFGSGLGSGAYLAALRRTRIGSFTVEQADTIDHFLEKVKRPEQK